MRLSSILYSKKGELGLTLALLSLVVMIAGSLFGTQVSDTMVKTSSQAAGCIGAGKQSCGGACGCNSDCLTSVTNSDGERVSLACDFKVKKCLPATGEKDRCDSTSGGGSTQGGNCGDICRADRDCNQRDTQDSSIRLRCDFSLVGSGRGKCQGFPNGRQCYNIPTPTARSTQPNPTNSTSPTGSTSQPTSIPIGGNAPGDVRFSTHPLSCGGIFRVIVDPVIDSITIKNTTQSFVLNAADEVTGSDTGRTSPVGYRVWMTHNRGVTVDNIKVDFSESVIRSGKRAVYLGLRSGGHPDPDYNQDAQVDMYYVDNVPQFVFDGSPKDIVLDYHVTTNTGGSRQQVKYYTQKIVTNGCSGDDVITPSVVVTPTPSPTRIPTPTTVIPTATETPEQCRESTNICFMIDASTTIEKDQGFRSVLDQLSQKINQYFVAHPEHNGKLTFSYKYFTSEVGGAEGEGVLSSANGYKFPNYVDNRPEIGGNLNRYTNIGKALKTGCGPNMIFVSDGVPSVVDAYQKDGVYCVFNNSLCMSGRGNCSGADRSKSYADGCLIQGVNYPIGASQCRGVAAYCEDKSYQDALNQTLSQMDRSAQYSYMVEKQDGTRIEEVMRKAGKIYKNGFASIVQDIDAIIENACAEPGEDNGRIERQFVTVGYSMSIENQSTSRGIESISLDLCDESGACASRAIEMMINPGQVKTTNDSFSSLSNSPITSDSTYELSCLITFEDGETQECGVASINGDNGVRYKVTVDDQDIDSQPKSYVDASDVDDNCSINALDFVRCLKQSETGVSVTSDACDIIFDNKINAQDHSVILYNMGKSCSR